VCRGGRGAGRVRRRGSCACPGAAGVSPAAVPGPASLPGLSPAQLADQRVIYSYRGLTPPAGLPDVLRHGEAAGVIFFGGYRTDSWLARRARRRGWRTGTWNCARAPGRSRRRAGSPRRWKRRPSPRAPAARRAPGDTPTRDSRGPAATPGRGSSARCAAGPGAGGRDRRAYRRAATSRCQRSTVSGRTTRCSLLSTSLGSRCSSAASNARSPGVNRTLSGPGCRCRTESWWRSARISASLSRLLIGGSRSSPNTFAMPR